MTRVARRLAVSRYFGDTATLVRVRGDYDDCGKVETTETETVIRCATAPATGDDARVRVVTEAGIQLDAMRRFWLADEVDPVSADGPGDIIVYADERWRVHNVQRWGPGASEVLAIREEGQ